MARDLETTIAYHGAYCVLAHTRQPGDVCIKEYTRIPEIRVIGVSRQYSVKPQPWRASRSDALWNARDMTRARSVIADSPQSPRRYRVQTRAETRHLDVYISG